MINRIAQVVKSIISRISIRKSIETVNLYVKYQNREFICKKNKYICKILEQRNSGYGKAMVHIIHEAEYDSSILYKFLTKTGK